MLIDRATIEDLSILDLLISKLEDAMNSKGIEFFEYERNEVDIRYVHSERDHNKWGNDDDFSNVEARLRSKPVKRIKLMFNSKADFRNDYAMEKQLIRDDGIYTASFLHVEWDYITQCFEIYVGLDSYEKDTSNSLIQKKIYKTDSKNSMVSIDFGSEYRREIRSMKVRLGKLYSKLIRDRKAEEEKFLRKGLTEAATQAFPDLLDPLILGGCINEDRDDRGVPSERGSDPEDTLPVSSGDPTSGQGI